MTDLTEQITEDESRPAAPAKPFRKRWYGKLLIVVAAICLMAAPAIGVYLMMRPNGAEAPAISSRTVTAIVSAETFEKDISASGTLTPAVKDSLSFAASGTVTEIFVEVGDVVEAGTVLATIDTLQLDAALATAEANLATAKAQLASAQESDDGSTTAASQITARERAVEVAQANYDVAEANLANANLVTPNGGLITAINIAVGDTVSVSGGSGSGSAGGMSAGGGQMGGGTSTASSGGAFELIGTDSWQITVNVSESNIQQIAVGNQVEITGDTLSETAFGIVSEIALLPSASGNTVVYPVVISVTGTPDGLYDGISVTTRIIYKRRIDVLSIPAAAVTTAEDGSTTVERVEEDGSTTTVVVEVGEASGTNVEIISGLAEGDSVSYEQITIDRSNENNNRDQTGNFPGGGQFPGGDFPGGGNFPGGGQMPDFGNMTGGGNYRGGR